MNADQLKAEINKYIDENVSATDELDINDIGQDIASHLEQLEADDADEPEQA